MDCVDIMETLEITAEISIEAEIFIGTKSA